nr:hypothetical protein [uncultured Pseudodesulfovibrio sp.]
MANTGIYRKFKRIFPYAKQFTAHPNFDEIRRKVLAGEIFPAIRENNMDFYFGGQRAFKRTRDILKATTIFWTNEQKKRKGRKRLSTDSLMLVD